MDKLAGEINALIKNSDVYKKYLACKESVDSNSELVILKEKMDEIKNANCKNRDESLVEEYNKLEKEYKNSILVKECEVYKKEIYELLSSISDILSFS